MSTFSVTKTTVIATPRTLGRVAPMEAVATIDLRKGMKGTYLITVGTHQIDDLYFKIAQWCREQDVSKDVILRDKEKLIILFPNHDDAVLCKLAVI